MANLDVEKSWIKGIHLKDENSFKKVFLKYFPVLSTLAADYVGSFDTGKEIAHEVLVSLWERDSELKLNGSLKSYLCQAVINRSITELRKEGRRRDMLERYNLFADHSGTELDQLMDARELEKTIWSAVSKLPKKRYLVVLLHKRYDLSYKEIAQVMGISIKTVENQMGSALKLIRQEVKRMYSEVKNE